MNPILNPNIEPNIESKNNNNNNHNHNFNGYWHNWNQPSYHPFWVHFIFKFVLNCHSLSYRGLLRQRHLATLPNRDDRTDRKNHTKTKTSQTETNTDRDKHSQKRTQSGKDKITCVGYHNADMTLFITRNQDVGQVLDAEIFFTWVQCHIFRTVWSLNDTVLPSSAQSQAPAGLR